MLSEKDLIKGCKECKIKAQEQLYTLYSRKMYGVCYYYTSNADDAKDLLHEGFIKIFDKIRQFKEEGSIEGWMRRVMVNAAVDFVKKRKARPDAVSSFEVEDFEEDVIDDSEEEQDGEAHFTQEEMLEAINNLPDEHRLIFNMFCLENYSHKEISELLGIREDTCRSKLRRGREMLRKYLEKLQKGKSKLKI